MGVLTLAHVVLSELLILCTKDIVICDHMLNTLTVHLLG